MSRWGRTDTRLVPFADGLYRVAIQYRLNPRITSTFRSYASQERLYRRYLRGESRFPAAPPGRSAHEKGLAFDMVSDDNEWLGAVWNNWGGKWSPTDSVHFGLHNWRG